MKKNRHYQILSRLCAGMLCAGMLCQTLPVRAEEKTQIIVNDSEVGNDVNQFQFSAGWVHEGGFPALFEGGDEHWTTNAQFGNTLPSFSMTFVGEKITLIGHRTNNGGMADVYIDGELAGGIDYYRNGRLNKDTLFESETLPQGEHTIRVVLNGKRNENAGTTFEAAIDYAVIDGVLTEYPATSISLNYASLTMEEGMFAQLEPKIGPSYATIIPDVVYASADESIASVDANGKITARKAGSTTITATLEGMELSASCQVSVREGESLIISRIMDENTHSYPDQYWEKTSSLYNTPSVVTEFGTLWKNDAFSSKVDVYTKGEEIPGAEWVIDSITDAKGNAVSEELMSAEMTWMSDITAHSNSRQVFDVISHESARDLKAMALHEGWLKVSSTAQTPAGDYVLKVSLRSGEQTLESYTWNLRVQDLALPDELETQMELWMYPYSVNRYYSGKTSEEYFGTSVTDLYNVHLDDAYDDALGHQLDLYKEAGGDAITVTVVEDAWNHQCHDPYPSMVKWKKNADGTFSFDYTDLDKWVQMNLDHGIDGQIKSFSMSCWGNRVIYYDEEAGKVVSESPSTGSERWKELWGAFMNDYAAHMEEKGWFDLCYMAMDERPIAEVTPVLDLVESVKNSQGEHMKTAIAVNGWSVEPVFDRLDDISFTIGFSGSKVREIADQRKAQGKLTTLYTCGGQNSATLNNPGESAQSIMTCWKNDTDGFLRWAFDSFNAEPLVNTNHVRFVPGDLYLVYPSQRDGDRVPQTTPRYEKLVEGNRMMNKLWILEREYPFLEAQIEKLKTSLSDDMTTANAQIAELSDMALDGTADPHLVLSEKKLTLKTGETQKVEVTARPSTLLDEAAYDVVETINDSDERITWIGEWIDEHGYSDLFVGGDDHYCQPENEEEADQFGYEFDFTGTQFMLRGNHENVGGIIAVTIDGQPAGEADLYGPGKTRFTTQYVSPILPEGEHHVRVMGAGKKHDAALAWNIQLDSIDIVKANPLIWTSSDEEVAEVKDGVITAKKAGDAIITVSIKEYTASLNLHVEASEQKTADKTLLKQAISYAESLDPSAFETLHPIVKARFDTALLHAKTVLGDAEADQQAVNKAWMDLSSAIHLLEFKADKTSLQALVEQAAAIDPETITDAAAKAAFIEALENAKAVLADENALNERIHEAQARLQAAMDGLIIEELDLHLLTWLVSQTADLELETCVDGNGAKAEFIAAREEAQGILAAPKSQQQIDASVDRLHNAWLSLRRKPDESVLAALKAALANLQSMDLSSLDAETRSAAEVLIQDLTEGLADPNLDQDRANRLLERVNALNLTNLSQNPAADLNARQNQSQTQSAASVKTGNRETMRTAGMAAAALTALLMLKKRRK